MQSMAIVHVIVVIARRMLLMLLLMLSRYTTNSANTQFLTARVEPSKWLWEVLGLGVAIRERSSREQPMCAHWMKASRAKP